MAKTIKAINGANLGEGMVTDTPKIVEITINVDDTTETVLDLLERYEIVELIFPPNVFVELPIETVKNKLTAHSIIAYGVAKRDYEATLRTEQRREEDPNYGLISFGEAGPIYGLMKSPKDDHKYHHAILNEYQMEAALAQGYERVPDKEVVNNRNERMKIDEHMYHVRCPIEKYKASMRKMSELSKKRIRGVVKSKNQEMEIRKDNDPSQMTLGSRGAYSEIPDE